MRFNVLVALLGVTSAINVRQTGAGAGTTATTATATGTTAAAAAGTTVTGGPGLPQCMTAPTGPPPSTMQCVTPQQIFWAQGPVVAAPCQWICKDIPMPVYTPPTRAEEIQDFASGFFDQCDADHSAYLTRKEMHHCIRQMMQQSRKSIHDQLKMQRKQLWGQFKWQKNQYWSIGNTVYDGASKQTGADKAKGVTITEVVAFLNKDWEKIQAIMNIQPPNMGPGGCNGPACGPNPPATGPVVAGCATTAAGCGPNPPTAGVVVAGCATTAAGCGPNPPATGVVVAGCATTAAGCGPNPPATGPAPAGSACYADGTC